MDLIQTISLKFLEGSIYFDEVVVDLREVVLTVELVQLGVLVFGDQILEGIMKFHVQFGTWFRNTMSEHTSYPTQHTVDDKVLIEEFP